MLTKTQIQVSRCKKALSIRREKVQDYQHLTLMLPTGRILEFNQLIHLLAFSAKYHFADKKQFSSLLLSMAGLQEFQNHDRSRKNNQISVPSANDCQRVFQQEWDLSPSFISLRKCHVTLNWWEKHDAILTVEQAIKILRGEKPHLNPAIRFRSGMGHYSLPTKVPVYKAVKEGVEKKKRNSDGTGRCPKKPFCWARRATMKHS